MSLSAMHNTRAQKELLLIKQKYTKLASVFESSRGQWSLTEKSFCRSTLRMVMAIEGLNPALDPHLQQISHLLQQRLSQQGDSIETRLDSLTHALLQSSKSTQDAVTAARIDRDQIELLFQFLLQLDVSAAHQQALQALKENALTGAYQQPSRLFAALNQLLQPAQEPNHSPESQSPPEALPISSLEESIRQNLLGILQVTGFPNSMRSRVESVTGKLRNAGQCHGSGLLTAVSEAMALYVDTITFMAEEQKALESFLTQLSGQLEDIEQQTSLTAATQADADNRRQQHHANMSDGLSEMQQATMTALDIASLKATINNKIGHLADLLEKQHQFEQVHRARANQEMAKLSSRIQSMELESRELHSRLQIAHHRALHDSLTDIPNRLALNETLPGMITKSQSSGSPLVCMIWDVDHFKSINDRFGHAAGDIVLKVVAGKIQNQLRKQDFLCRLGGEEFFTLHPDTSIEEGQKLADQLRHAIANSGFNSGGKPINITISCGISELQPGDSGDQLMEKADKALYIAKNRGRNRCERYPTTQLA